MIPLANKQAQIRFNYINQPLPQVALKSSQVQKRESIKIDHGMRQSEQKAYKFQAYSSLQLQTKKKLATQKKIYQPEVNSYEYVETGGLNNAPETYQSLHKAEQLDPVVSEIAYQKVSIPVLRAENTPNGPSKFKIEGITQIKESDFLTDANNSRQPDARSNLNTNSPYDSNPYSNLYSRGGQGTVNNRKSEQNQPQHHGKRNSRQIKTFKIGELQEKKETEFTGCCGFGITNKIAFLSRDK